MQCIDLAVLVLGFNRPTETARVIDALRPHRPHKVFFAVDGAREHVATDVARVAEVRALVSRFDWGCEVQTLFRDKNLGCGRAVSGAIHWFFDHVEEGVILEDDCLPLPEFVPFCQKLLEYYRHDDRICHISGNNFQLGRLRGPGSYYFSRYVHIWGWATWRRAWKGYCYDLPPESELRSLPAAVRKWLPMKMLLQVAAKKLDTWDVQWLFYLLTDGKLAVTPNTNLVRNIGFDFATHTLEPPYYFQAMNFSPLTNLIHPFTVSADDEADDFTNRLLFNLSPYNWFLDKWRKGKSMISRTFS